jgi:hypothetical protein
MQYNVQHLWVLYEPQETNYEFRCILKIILKTDLKNFIKSRIVQNWQRSPILGFKVQNNDS